MLQPWFRHALERKRDGGTLDGPTWTRIVEGYVAGTLDEAAVAALLMASVIVGLDGDETFALTAAMIRSGDTLPLAEDIVDKHSSGGVADTVSLIAVPLVAACGVKVAKLSGHALGHTGGTLDKLEAIPGMRTDLTPKAFRAQVEAIGCAIAAQSDRLVPADKKIYDLRDRTATVPSLGLIASSIVSKKIASGAGAVVFDVKAGAGSFLRDEAMARELAARMVELCGHFGRRASALVTGMEEPLGASIGTALEAIEARDFLAGTRRDPRLAHVTEVVAGEMLHVAGVAEADAAERLRGALAGAAYEKFVAMVEAQGGSRAALEGLRPAAARAPVRASRSGTLAAVDDVRLGMAARALVEAHGSAAGIVVRRRIGEAVTAGDVLAEIVGTTDGAPEIADAFAIADGPVAPSPLILARIRAAGEAGTTSKRLVI
jgi:pyrimidine-nucleoside phosphorylase